jgi:putative exporter of polyketide antibiotics
LEIYDQAAGMNPFEAQTALLGLVALLVGLLHQSEAFDRLVSSRIKGPLYLAYGTYGLPLTLLLMEIQRRTPRRPGGGFRVLGVLVLIVVLVILGVLALIAFLIYRYLRRRR